MRVRGLAIIGMAVLLALVACGGGAPPREFPAATLAQVEHVEAFLQDGYSLRNAHTAPPAGGDGYFVAAEIVASGEVGVWWHSGTTSKPTMTLAVDNIAGRACVCPWIQTTRSTLRMRSMPAEELKRFVQGKVRESQ